MFSRTHESIRFPFLSTTAALMLTAGAGLGCSTDPAEDGPPAVQQRIALTAFDNCSDLERHVEDTAVQMMRSQLEGQGYYWARGGWGPEVAADAGTTGAPNQQRSEPDAYTTTNVQVQGVDEADFVKNNGTHIFVISANRLYISQSWPAADLSVLGHVDLEGYPSEMFFDDEGDRIAVLASVFAPYAVIPGATSIDCLAYGYGYCGNYAVATKVTTIDVSNPSAPSITGEHYFPGWLENSRRIGSSVRLVLNDQFQWPDDMQWWVDYEEYTDCATTPLGDYRCETDEDRLEELLAELADENEAIIRAQSLRDWVPEGVRRLEDGSLVNVAYDCRDFHQVNAPVTLGFTTVATLNLDKPNQPPARTSIIADTSEVYASLESLYLATRHWWWWPAPGQEDYTYLFKFDITDPDHATFVAAGSARGHILNQFSMDEHDGYLRIATTIARRVEDPNNPDNTWGMIETTNQVSVLAEDSGGLDVVGQTEEIAEGERIQSARFIGEKGFVVTFEQIDPLFTLDLSNPANPEIIGELKVPGFSSYIHPLDQDHLLTIGVHLPEPDAQGQVDWSQRSMKLTIFDVSDFENPTEKFTQNVGTAYGWSEAAWNHKAFNYFPERGLLAIPFSDYRPNTVGEDYWNYFVSELRVFSVDKDTGFVPRGAISMSDLYRTYEYEEWSWSYSPWIRRSVMADEFVYAISDAGIRVADVADLASTLATAEFEPLVHVGTGE